MELNATLNQINSNRTKVEAAFVFSLWKDPTQYEDYKSINEGDDKSLQNKDAQFYFSLGKQLWLRGCRTIDNITIEAYLNGNQDTKTHFESLGGWKECEKLMSLVDSDNTAAYYDEVAKMNSLSIICSKYNEMFEHLERFNKCSNEDIYNTFDLLNNEVALVTGHDAKFESLVVDDNYLQTCNNATDVGLSYRNGAPTLNWLTLGIPKGDMTIFAAHSGQGKSSFIFESVLLPIYESGHKVAIISNEMQAKAYKELLLIHVLTHDLNCWSITRKTIKSGHYTDIEYETLRKAAQITKEKYSGIVFVKMFENKTSKVLKYIRRLARSGVECFFYDTMKSDDNISDNVWQQLLLDSRKIFNVVSRENVAFIASFQLALHTTNQRWLDASCLSSSKQIKEVVSELVMMRKLWQDEYPGKRYDCHPYVFEKDANNKTVKKAVDIDPNKTYIVMFLNKTRNDQDGQTLLYEWQGHFNRFKEVGRCTILNDHRTNN